MKFTTLVLLWDTIAKKNRLFLADTRDVNLQENASVRWFDVEVAPKEVGAIQVETCRQVVGSGFDLKEVDRYPIVAGRTRTYLCCSLTNSGVPKCMSDFIEIFPNPEKTYCV